MAKLTLVPTPIGNLEDITLRALNTLKRVQLILAEDTRTTGILLAHYGIKCPLASHHMHNEHKLLESVLLRIEQAGDVALVSDAGTPAVSDPGFLLVRACLQRGIEVECLPGATALIPALVSSGLPADRFVFEGFLPQKKGRQSRLQALAQEKRTIILYESPYRVLKTLSQLAEIKGIDCPAVAAREISKLHEEIVRGSLGSLIEHFTTTAPRGEFVLVIGAKATPTEETGRTRPSKNKYKSYED